MEESDSDKTTMKNISSPALSQYNSTQLRVEFQSDEGYSELTSPAKFNLKERSLFSKQSDSESFLSYTDSSFAQTSYNPYLESGSMIRVDNLFKPLLRRFRDYLRTRFNSKYDRRNHSRWPISKHVQLVETFMAKELSLPH